MKRPNKKCYYFKHTFCLSLNFFLCGSSLAMTFCHKCCISMPDEVTLIFHSPIFLLHVSWEESFTIKLSWKTHKSILIGNIHTNTNFINQEDDDNDDVGVWRVWCFYIQVLSVSWELNGYYKFRQSQQSGATLLSFSDSKYHQNKQTNKKSYILDFHSGWTIWSYTHICIVFYFLFFGIYRKMK